MSVEKATIHQRVEEGKAHRKFFFMEINIVFQLVAFVRGKNTKRSGLYANKGLWQEIFFERLSGK